MLRVTLLGLRYRKARLALSALAIAAGVAFVAGTLMMTASIRQSYSGSFSAGARNVSVAVAERKSGDPPGQIGGQVLPASALAAVRAVPGVAAAAGRLGGPASLLGRNGKLLGPGFGINVTALNPFTLVSGHLPGRPDQVDVDASTAADEHFRLGQALRVVDSAGRIRTCYLAGTIDLGVSSEFGNASVTAFQTATAIAVTGQHGYNLIVARAAPGVSPSALAARVSARLSGQGDEVITGAELATDEASSTAHVSKVLTTGLLIFALISLVVACIVVYNTFNILIAQRSRELALQRCVGASRGQVFGSMLAESALTGLAASVAGAATGIAVSWGLLRVVSTHPPLVISPSAITIALATGLLVTVAASVLPARAATRVAPLAALTVAVEPAMSARIGWRRVAVAAGSVTAGAGLAYAGVQLGSTNGLVGLAAGGCLCFVAVLALGPLIAPPVIACLGWLPARLTRVTAQLATANARRNPHRVATTTAALTIGITLMALFSVVVSSAQKSTDAAIDGHYPFDYMVRSTESGQPVPPRIIAALERSPRLALVAAVYQGTATVGGQTGMPLGAYSRNALGTAVRPAMVSGSLTAIGPGTAAVDITALPALHTSQGGTIAVHTPDAGPERLRVVAVYNSGTYKSPLPAVLISAADYQRGYRPAGPDMVVADAAPGVSTAASRAVVTSAVASDPLLEVDTAADYKAQLDHSVDTILEIFAALLGLAILIALFGISSTLTLSVIERTRESALLRALGLTRGQLRWMLLCEAVLMAALAAVLGIGLGSAFGLATVRALSSATSGRVTLSVPYAQLALYALVSACAGLLAAIMPARRAARTSVVAVMADQ
jgi:putative ABC transport system permease protein